MPVPLAAMMRSRGGAWSGLPLHGKGVLPFWDVHIFHGARGPAASRERQAGHRFAAVAAGDGAHFSGIALGGAGAHLAAVQAEHDADRPALGSGGARVTAVAAYPRDFAAARGAGPPAKLHATGSNGLLQRLHTHLSGSRTSGAGQTMSPCAAWAGTASTRGGGAGRRPLASCRSGPSPQSCRRSGLCRHRRKTA